MKHFLKIFVIVLTFIIGMSTWINILSVSAAPEKRVNHTYKKGQILVKFKDGTSSREIDNQIRNNKSKLESVIPGINVHVLKVPESAEEKVIFALSHNPNVEFAELDYLASVFMNPNDTYFSSNQWGLENTGQQIAGRIGTIDADIDSSTAWDITQGNVKVAILDTGIDQDHVDLSSKIVDQRNFTDSSSIDDIYGHGTHVAGIVAAITNNSVGVAGGCPNCVLINAKVLNDSGSGANSWIANGIIWSTNNGAKVINMSLGSSMKSRTLENAVNYAWNNGVVVVGAAGNSGNSSKTYPAAYTNVIAVAATNNNDQKASFSNYGTNWVDVAAPGEHIFSTFPNHTFVIQTRSGRNQNYDFASGTSMATPMTSAVAALIWSTSYGTSMSQVRLRLQSTSDRITGTGSYWSAGRINADRAVGSP